MRLLTLSFLSLLFIISGCKEEAKTTQWYKDHPDELKAVYENAKKQAMPQITVKTPMKPIIKFSS